MPLYKQAGSDFWFVDITIKGQRIRRSAGTTSKQQAQEYHDRLKFQAWSQDKLGKSAYTWDDAVKRYVTEKADKRTIEHDKTMLRWSLPYLQGKALAEIDKDLIEAIITKRRAGESDRTKDGVKNSTINRHMEAIQRVLNCAIEWGWLTAAPKIRRLTEPKGRVRWLTKDEQTRLLAALPPHLKAMAEFTLATGLRENNVLGLEWPDVDEARRVCWIHPDQSKTNQSISVPLNNRALAVLAGQKGKHARLVFPYNKRAMVKASSAGWYKALKTAKIDDFTWHGLRHTWASWHVMNGTPLAVLQKLGGWSSIQIVMRYSHLSPEHVASFSENAP